MQSKNLKNYLSAYIWLPLIFFIAAVVFAYWDRVDPAQYVTDMGGFIMGFILWYIAYMLGKLTIKKISFLKSGTSRKQLNRYSWIMPVAFIVLCTMYLFPQSERMLLGSFGVNETATADEVYYTYGVAPLGLNAIWAGAKKTDAYSATTEVVKYTTVNTHTSSTLDFPYSAYNRSSKSSANAQILQGETIRVRYLKPLPFIVRLDEGKN